LVSAYRPEDEQASVWDWRILAERPERHGRWFGMGGILEGMRIVEGSAFVAAPLGGMTLAQLGADVIRFDPIGGGLDRGRWPITDEGRSLFWAGLNKGKRSIQVDLGSPAGRELAKRGCS
jgi:crotonobetainyl-CoA:carnitine CoA-transferase CaiB-like acyl-CoA transferase